jgi:phenylacetate-CoA ligase
VLHALQRGNTLPPGDRAVLGSELSKRSLRSALRTHYGRGRSKNLGDWPVLDRDLLRESPRYFVNPLHFLRVPASTGGTTGVPLKLWRSIECVVAEQVFIDDLLAPYGHSMHGSRVATLRADKVKDLSDSNPPYGRLIHGGIRLLLSTPHMNARTIGWFCEALHEFAPSVLWAYPSAALNLMKLTEHTSLRPKFSVLLVSSEMLSSALHLALERHFSCRVINYYGQAERVCFAHSVKPTEFYFNPWYGRVELLGAEECKEEPARRVNIVATGYWNAAMPLVRYETGDTLLVPKSYGESEIAEVALGSRPFIRLEGRSGEYLLTRQGMRIIGLNQIPREVANVLQVQLVQKDFESVVINVVATSAFSPNDAAQLLDQAKAKIPPSIQLTLNVVDRLLTNANGKAPFVLRMND